MSRQARKRWRHQQKNARYRYSWIFRATSYRSELGALAVGERHPWLDEWLRAKGQRYWIWLTAENPAALQCAEAANKSARNELATLLTELQMPRLSVVAQAAAGDWPEEAGELCAGLPLGKARRLGKKFGQLALLAGKYQGRARIVWLAAN
jgi:hypothetical protein